MLVITRKHGERLVIGREIEVTVLQVRGNRVKLGISGPVDVPIHRQELLARLSQPTVGATMARLRRRGEERSRMETGSQGVSRSKPG